MGLIDLDFALLRVYNIFSIFFSGIDDRELLLEGNQRISENSMSQSI